MNEQSENKDTTVDGEVEQETTTLEIEVPKEALERADGHLSVTFDPVGEQQARNFEGWVAASGFPKDVWLLLNTETGTVEKKYV